VVYRVGDAGDRHQRQQRPVKRQHSDQQENHALEQDTRDENTPGAVTIDGEAHGCLRQPADQAEQRQCVAKLGKADPVYVDQDREQRRQQQQVEMAQEMRAADQGNGAFGGGVDDLRRRDRHRVIVSRGSRREIGCYN
jgi:hypothetical protein